MDHNHSKGSNLHSSSYPNKGRNNYPNLKIDSNQNDKNGSMDKRNNHNKDLPKSDCRHLHSLVKG